MIKPILFNTAMVQAILEGRKTTTRRIIKDVDNNYTYLGSDKQKKTVSFARNTTGLALNIKIPCKAGDILYVRETWKAKLYTDSSADAEITYRADDAKNYFWHIKDELFDKLLKFSAKEGWQPSLFMPKEVARIFLKVTDVRVERLQDITEEGIRAEGITEEWPPYAMDKFQELWDSTTKEYKWQINPWVWVISFERCEKTNE